MVNHETEIEAGSVEDAIKKGLEKLGLQSRDEMEWKVIYDGEEGVKIKVKNKVDEPKSVKLVEEEISTFLEKLGTTGKVEIEQEHNRLYINIKTKDMDGLLIGKSGRNLESIQHILSRIIHNKDNSIDLTIDVAGYRRKKEHTLKVRARAFAEEVKRSGREFIFEPLPPSLRRAVHLEISDIEGVRTYTIGETDLKKVVISPAKK
ncbi:MAG: KH domain-containing protein [Candidatus Stahlbacteria bacterium]|nr:MAG: KH domain-containing protein [Candidatus Stahlbacteria bacterium]